ncbi:hypothetical protein [Neptuniibacter sp. QD37_11]|uniref:hypothetical protein n=1 Tax=Neptuniibacter sp. QD37_11 TaxID=3398209 RepID=UPI0039F51175
MTNAHLAAQVGLTATIAAEGATGMVRARKSVLKKSYTRHISEKINAMIFIENISPEEAPNIGLNHYRIRTAAGEVGQFNHEREIDGLGDCLRDAADFLDQDPEAAEKLSLKYMIVNLMKSDANPTFSEMIEPRKAKIINGVQENIANICKDADSLGVKAALQKHGFSEGAKTETAE